MKLNIDDTIAAPATIPGTGAITVIRVSGPDCFNIVDKVVKLRSGTIAETEGGRIKYGSIIREDGSEVDEVLASVFRAPHSYTGEDSVEISCHASSYIASEILRLLCDAGARMAEPGEYSRRAFVNSKLDLAQAEAVADVISSSNSASLRVAMNQLRGGYSSELQSLRARLLEMSSLLELELDFSEEDVEFADRSRLKELLDSAISHIHSLTSSFRYGNALRNGVPVAIVGAVNAGKSTLLNALLGDDRAIVSDVAGTTRDTVEETVVIDGVLFRFVDTAGLRETSDVVEKIGISRSYRKLSEASVVLALLDVSASEEENEASISDIVSKMDLESQKMIVLLNKVDILGSSAENLDYNNNVSILNKTVSSPDEKVVKLYISAKNGFGLDELRKWLVTSQKDLSAQSEGSVVTNFRHYQALSAAASALAAVRSGIDAGRSGVDNVHLGLDASRFEIGDSSSAEAGRSGVDNIHLEVDTSRSGINAGFTGGGGATPDILAEDLRQALYHLGSITGEITTDEVLGTIFERFCIGK